VPGRIINAHSINSTVRFHCLDERLADRFEFLAAEPDVHDLPDTFHNVGTASACEDFYDFEAPYDGQPGTCDHLLNRAHQLLRDLLTAETAGCPVIHGASIVVNGKRILLMAEKGVGKTTLSVKCLAAGFAVEGDEHVVVRSGDVVARPRTLRVKQGSISVVPELAQQIQDSPRIAEWNGDLIYSLVPRLAGQPWTIRPGRAHALLFLTANHGGLTSIKFLTANEAFGRLIKTAYLPENGGAAALGRLRVLVSGARCIEMRLGCLETALWHLRQLSDA
jgi:hypothetical protein